MKKTKNLDTLIFVERLYSNISKVLKKRKIRWSDLSIMIGLQPNTLSSMRAQKTNPNILTVKKIADFLEVSIDELLVENDDDEKLYDLCWTIKNYSKNAVQLQAISEQFLVSTHVLIDGIGKSIVSREVVCRERVKSKIELKIEVDKVCNIEV